MAHYPGDLVLSERDANAPTLDDIPSAGVLPTWRDTRAYVDNLLKAAKSA